MKKFVSVLLIMVLLLPTVVCGNKETAEASALRGKLNKKSIVLLRGKKFKLKVLNAGSARINFSSTKEKVAKVYRKGTVKGLKKGKAVIVAQIISKKAKKAKKLRCKVKVIEGAKKLKVTQKNGKVVKKLTIQKNKSIQLKTKITPKKSNDMVTWTSDDSYIASVKKGKIKGNNVGETIIRATTYSGKKVKIKVKVTLPPLEYSLKELYKNDFRIGVAANSWQLEGIGGYSAAQSLIVSQFNSVTYENEMKPYSLISTDSRNGDNETEVVINTGKLDEVLTEARDNGLKVRGHCLVWHSQTPDWFFRTGFENYGDYVTKDVMKQRMESYIRQVMQYCQTNYPGIVYAWDVVNEAVGDDGKMRDEKTSNWYKVYGDDSYITDAFTFARKYSTSGVSLFLNDYNEYIPKKRDLLYAKLKELYEAGLCDGMGMQSHYSMNHPQIAQIKVAIEKYNSIAPGKIQIQLTELDIHNNDSSQQGQKALAEWYKDLFTMLLEEKREKGVNITNVTFWGLTDGDTWLSQHKGETSFPLLFSEDYGAKLAYYAVVEAVK